MTKKNPQGEVWIFAEQQDGKLNDVALELCGKARALADVLGVKVGAVLPGYQVAGLAPALFAHGVDRLYLVDDPNLRRFTSAPYAFVMEKLIDKYAPQILKSATSSTPRRRKSTRISSIKSDRRSAAISSRRS